MVTRKQHTVPRFYLKGFASDDKVWAARKGPDGSFYELPKTNVANLCSRRDYYEVESSSAKNGKEFIRRNRIEDWLSELEHELAPSLRKVTEAPNTQALEIAMRQSPRPIRILLANLIVRNPMMLDPSREIAEKFTEKMISDGLLTKDDVTTIEEMGFMPKDLAEYSILQTELQSLKEGSSMERVLSWLDDAGVIVLRAKDGMQFVTADIPFVLGWDNAESEQPAYVFFPLDWRTAVVFHKYDREVTSFCIDAGHIAFWNQILICFNEDTGMVIAKSERVLQHVVGKYNDEMLPLLA